MLSPQQRADELRRAIAHADDLYYNQGRPELTDAEYDALFAELRALEAAQPELATPDSPTQRVGAPLPRGAELEAAEHLAPMLSIDSLTSEEQVREFDARARRFLGLAEGDALRWAVEPKLDGVSANLLYEGGRLARGTSRGDGGRGEVITAALRTIRAIPLTLRGPAPPRLEVRGEVILSRDAFAGLRDSIETTTETPFRNARNAVAGTLKLLDPALVARRRLEFFAWGVGFAEGLEVATFAALRQRLAAFGFRLVEPFIVGDTVDDVVAFRDRLEAEREKWRYEMDGVVAKVDRLDLQRRLDRTARSPRWALAYKFTARTADTTVVAILAQVGRTGAVTPVAELAPVELAGVTVRRATLHNWGLLRERDVRAGDRVRIQRAGDVIPEIVKVHAEARGAGSEPPPLPGQCPSCSAALQPEGAFLYCVNLDCPAQLKGRIVHLASRRALDIDRLGPKYVDQLVEAGIIATLEDVLTLPERSAAVLALERWGERSWQKLVAEIEQAKRPSLWRLLYALGIRHVGEQTARDLAAHFADLESLAAADEQTLQQVDGVGPEVAKAIRAFFALEANQRFLHKARAAGLEVAATARAPSGRLAGRVFCFTGGLESLTRDEAKALVEELGASTSAGVTSQVTDVVAGAKAGSKVEKARALGLRVLDEAQLLSLLGRAT